MHITNMYIYIEKVIKFSYVNKKYNYFLDFVEIKIDFRNIVV